MDEKDEYLEVLKKLRREIYFRECANLHKKNPEKNEVMVDKIISIIKNEASKGNKS